MSPTTLGVYFAPSEEKIQPPTCPGPPSHSGPGFALNKDGVHCFSLSCGGCEVQRAQLLNLPWSLPWTTALWPGLDRDAPQRHPALPATGAFLSPGIRHLGFSLHLWPFPTLPEKGVETMEGGEDMTSRGEFRIWERETKLTRRQHPETTWGGMRSESKDRPDRE